MKLYCEVVVQDILPAVRSLITKELIQSFKMNQVEISRRLGVTQPAVSLYKKEMRGSRIKRLAENKEVMKLVRNFSRDIASKNIPPEEIQHKFLEISHKIVDKKLASLEDEELISSEQIPCNICFKS